MSGSVVVRSVVPDDGPALSLFAAQVSQGERRFVKEDLRDLALVSGAADTDPGAHRLIAVDGKRGVIGFAGAYPQAGWSSHVAELRVLVGPQDRGRGVGRALARAALKEVLRLDCSVAYIEVVSEQEALVSMFQDLGFEPVALLPDFVRDEAGELRDLMIMALRLDDQWLLRAVGFDDVAVEDAGFQDVET
jgi:L-amino acid N-acyltransferase YncA